MSMSRRGLATVGGALLILGVVGAGIAQAAPAGSTTEAAGPALDAPPLNPGRGGLLRDRLARLGSHVVHATITLTDKDGNLITVQVDHGTISTIGDDSITIAEAGGSSVTVATSDETRVRKDRGPSSLAQLVVGDEVYVHSRIDDGSAVARLVIVPAPFPDPGAGAS